MSEVATPDATLALQERSPLLRQIAASISPGNPAGDDVTYDDDFQRVKAEIDKLESASTGSVDYERVVELSQKVLAAKSKDLRVATYLAMGLTNTRGLRGAAEGVAAVALLTQTFWGDLHPPLKRAAARRNALQALSDRLKEWVAAARPEEADGDLLEQAVSDVRGLQEFVMKEMGEQAPAISGLVKAFEDALRRVPKAPPPSAAAPTTASTAPVEPPQPVRPPPPLATPAAGATEAFRSVAEAERVVFRVASYLFDQEKTSPVPFALVRVIRWGALHQLPPNEGGKTLLGPPEPQRRTFLNGLLERGEYGTLLEEVEASFRESPFWLDLQRLATSAMDALGAPYARARDAILYETAVVLQRLARLPGLAFNDGTPFADPATLEWIDARVKPMLGQAEAAAASAADNGNARLSERFREARGRLGNNDLAGALAVMQDGAGEDRSTQDRFRRQLFLASLCVRGGQPAIARPMLEALSEQVGAHGLDTWDPALAIEVWTNLYRCYTALAGKKAKTPDEQAFLAQADHAFDQVCRLDAQYALSLAGTR